MNPRIIVVALALLAAALVPSVQAEPPLRSQLGLQVGYDNVLDRPYLGAEFLVPMDRGWFFVGDIQYVHRPRSQHVTLSAGVHYAHTLHKRVFGWAGAGIALISEDPDGPMEGDTRNGFGLVTFGVGWDGVVLPTLQVRIGSRNGGRVTFGAGVRF